MRDLTIRRRKVFAGCLAKLKVYVEDPYSSEIRIDNTPCRFLGRLKTGETQTFQVGDEAVKIYVIADKLSKEYANEYYQLPEGTEDIVLEGQVKLSPGNNMFRFDNNNSEGIREKRKKGSRIGIAVLVGAVIVGVAVGRLIPDLIQKGQNNTPKQFSAEGMTITLTEAFKSVQISDFTSCYESKEVLVMNMKQSFAEIPGLKSMTLEEYRTALTANVQADREMKDYGGIPGFEYDYTSADQKESYHYRVYLFKTDDAFWIVEFATRQNKFSSWESRIDEWAKSVKFAG